MDEGRLKKISGCTTSGGGGGYDGDDDTVWECVIPYVEDPLDRGAVSLVCKRWYEIDAITRKHVTMALCYTAPPWRLSRRFPQLESLKLKGKPRAAMFNLIPEDWGGYVAPWVEEIVRSFGRMKVLHFRRMIVKDSDLQLLAASFGEVLEVLRLDKCSGFSTDGLLHITRSCRNLRSLFLEESSITENDGQWLHVLAQNNKVLESLNFYMTELMQVSSSDLEMIARNCPSLTTMKISDCDISDLVGFFKAATSLEEFCGGSFSDPPGQVGEVVYNEQLERYGGAAFPPKLCRLALTYLGNTDMPILYPIASRLKRLDLLYALLDTEGHCLLLQRCPNLEILETRNVIGDRGVEVLAEFCKRMKRLRIERGADEQDIEDVEGVVTQRGLTALAQGCLEIEYIAIYVSDITNASLESFGTHSKNLRDFRLRRKGKMEIGLLIANPGPARTAAFMGGAAVSRSKFPQFLHKHRSSSLKAQASSHQSLSSNWDVSNYNSNLNAQASSNHGPSSNCDVSNYAAPSWMPRFEELDTTNMLLRQRIIFLGTQVDDMSADFIISQLLLLDSEDNNKDIKLFINSPGGSVTAGMGIYDAMKLCKCDVSTICVGIAASMGAFILAAGTKGKRLCMPNARVMIHQPHGAAGGKLIETVIRANEMCYHKVKINKILSRITGKPEQQIKLDTDCDNFMDAWEAKAYGLVDEIINDGKPGLVAPIGDLSPPPKIFTLPLWKFEIGDEVENNLPSEEKLLQNGLVGESIGTEEKSIDTEEKNIGTEEKEKAPIL
ncbi:Coronatine-insensitive protein 1 [Striga hermonthica]|uniref:ATP-dependent Clp protease proteolytic subunit n=1 Tax=Striga hermonthica TaxID=68872 RepID=A0A9N7NV47_STRHE|nr:Coronatine-insensitive protein 1 [Striga hermonthica]